MNRACEIDRVLKDCSAYCLGKGKLFVGLANPSPEAIRDMAFKDRKWEMDALCRLLSLKNSLLEKEGFDYVIFDSSPGLNYSSINAVVSADVVLMASTLDKSDMKGTQMMVHELFELFDKKTGVIMNKVPFHILPLKNLERRLESLHLPIVGAIPCLCDILESEDTSLLPKSRITFLQKH